MQLRATCGDCGAEIGQPTRSPAPPRIDLFRFSHYNSVGSWVATLKSHTFLLPLSRETEEFSDAGRRYAMTFS